MKFILAIFLFLIPMSQGATTGNPLTVRINTASTNIAATFASVPQFVAPNIAITQIDINNYTASEIEVNCSESTVPSSNASDSVYLLPYSSYRLGSVPLLSVPLGKYCWVRSFTGTISSGIIYLTGLVY